LEGYEAACYDRLWSKATGDSGSSLKGREAVQFFMTCGLDRTVLRDVWTLADSQKRHKLTQDEFNVAVRLICLAAHGKSFDEFDAYSGTELTVPELWKDVEPKAKIKMVYPKFKKGQRVVHTRTSDGLVRFGQVVGIHDDDAVNGIYYTVRFEDGHEVQTTEVKIQDEEVYISNQANSSQAPAPPSVEETEPISSSAEDSDWTIDPGVLGSNLPKYVGIFKTVEQGGFVFGQAAVKLFEKSGLDESSIQDLLQMADLDHDGKLSKPEFCIAFHIAVAVKKGKQFPSQLPQQVAQFFLLNVPVDTHVSHTDGESVLMGSGVVDNGVQQEHQSEPNQLQERSSSTDIPERVGGNMDAFDALAPESSATKLPVHFQPVHSATDSIDSAFSQPITQQDNLATQPADLDDATTTYSDAAPTPDDATQSADWGSFEHVSVPEKNTNENRDNFDSIDKPHEANHTQENQEWGAFENTPATVSTDNHGNQDQGAESNLASSLEEDEQWGGFENTPQDPMASDPNEDKSNETAITHLSDLVSSELFERAIHDLSLMKAGSWSHPGETVLAASPHTHDAMCASIKNMVDTHHVLNEEPVPSEVFRAKFIVDTCSINEEIANAIRENSFDTLEEKLQNAVATQQHARASLSFAESILCGRYESRLFQWTQLLEVISKESEKCLKVLTFLEDAHANDDTRLATENILDSRKLVEYVSDIISMHNIAQLVVSSCTHAFCSTTSLGGGLHSAVTLWRAQYKAFTEKLLEMEKMGLIVAGLLNLCKVPSESRGPEHLVSPETFCQLTLYPMDLSSHPQTNFSGRAYISPALNLWLNRVSSHL